MELKKQGIWFNYYGDNMLWLWPWKRDGGITPALYSSIYDKRFKTKNEYWRHVGALEEATRKHRVRSFDETHVLEVWVKSMFHNDNIVVLKNINISAKDSSFWLKLPQHYRPHFLGDYVVLTCGSSNEIYRLCDSIPIVFAQAYGFSGGKFIYWNEPDTTKDETISWEIDEQTFLKDLPI